MASWLFGSTLTPLQQYDELLQEATSELLPTPALNGAPSPDTLDKCLRMSDMVRSGQVKAADAVRGLRRRIAHTNPK
jgi:growth factor-regulated tyrosine kinase substrate